jgi:four helix bundle protein
MSVHRFAHHRLDCFHVAKAALVLGDQIVRELCEGVAREGADRKQRLRIARAECNEAAGATEGIEALKLVDSSKTQELLTLLDRVAAMLTRLGGLGRR